MSAHEWDTAVSVSSLASDSLPPMLSGCLSSSQPALLYTTRYFTPAFREGPANGRLRCRRGLVPPTLSTSPSNASFPRPARVRPPRQAGSRQTRLQQWLGPKNTRQAPTSDCTAVANEISLFRFRRAPASAHHAPSSSVACCPHP